MSDNEAPSLSALEETEEYRLATLISPDALSLDVVSAYAGDRALTENEIKAVENAKIQHGDGFFPHLLYVVTHQTFSPAVAENLWKQILQHKFEMSFRMQRNMRITVASLDYLTNLTGELQAATVIDEAHMAEIIKLSQIDGLTGLCNHACCFQKIDVEIKRYLRYGTPLSLLMMDIDDFKVLNDRYGHQEGDLVLAEMGKVIMREARDSDSCCRYGGEEFSVVLPSTEGQEACAFAERLRVKLSESMPGGHALTLSIGVATCTVETASSFALVKRADMALYQAKNEGKNRVVFELKNNATLPGAEEKEGI